MRHVVHLAGALSVALPVALSAQTLPVLPASEFRRVETLQPMSVSTRGNWVAYLTRRLTGVGDSSRVVYLQRRAPDTTIRLDWAQNPQISRNEAWATWATVPTDAERARLTTARQPVRNRAVFMNLATLKRDSVDGVANAAFDATGKYLVLEQYPARDTADHKLVMVVDLATGKRTTIGSVSEWRWSDRGSLLALTLGVRDGGPGGLQLYNAAAGTLTALGTSGYTYRQTRWRKNAFDLISLRARAARGAADAAHRAEVWRGLDRTTSDAVTLSDTVPGIADTLVLVAHSAPTWSEDGTRLRLGVRPRVTPPDTSARARRDTLPGVQIWHPTDVQIFPAQQQQAAAMARRSIPLLWNISTGRTLLVPSALDENVEFLGDWSQAYVTSDKAYAWGTMFGRRYHDGFLVDLTNGTRKQVLDSVRYSFSSAKGRYILSFDGKDYHALNVSTGQTRNLTGTLGATFAVTDYDTPTDLLPPHGRGGWLDNDAGVLLFDEYDVWLVRPDGTGGSRLTRGREDSVIHRPVMLDTSRTTFDSRQPIMYALRGYWTEQRGYARGVIGRPIERLMLRDRAYVGLQKADSADVLIWREESRQQAPQLFVSDGSFRNPQQLSKSNTFLTAFAPGKTELVRYKNETGRDLKGVLLYPVNYDPSKKYPMIVYAYELLSNTLHSWQAPSERSYYNFTRWTLEGYFVLMPDIHFRHGDPGVSLLETLRPAIGGVVSRGLVDEKRVGFVGHSWGGYEGAYVATHSTLFAASIAGAPLTDFLSFMGQIHWNGGSAEVDHWETGQARMAVPYWENRESHRRNSPIEKVETMTTPLLLAHGNKDRVVEYWQSTVLYNFARRAGKPVVFLTYEDEDHGFTQEANQVDYHRRILEWFGHYLKGDAAPSWISKGIPFNALEAEKRRVKDRK
ncbi:MAG: S9 family peptidase [Gemmatimonadaceae bacterium]|nr:S9 family peptidase [Gemmatimonadaceae bacterium]